MNVSRASFLKVCGVALLGAHVDALSIADLPAIHASLLDTGRHFGPLRVADATAPLFRPHLNTPFAIRSANGARASLVLVEVTERPVAKNVEQFSLIFHAAPGSTIRDGIHTVEHEHLGSFDLFIVPVGAATPRRTVYQACFSRHLRT